jgi:hypothetical protein
MPEPQPAVQTESADQATTQLTPGAKLITEPPTLGGQLTANTVAEASEPMTDPLSLARPEDQIIDSSAQKAEKEAQASPAVNTTGKTLADIEKDVNSPHLQQAQANLTDSNSEKAVDVSSLDTTGKTLTDIEKDVNSPHLAQPPELIKPEKACQEH